MTARETTGDLVVATGHDTSATSYLVGRPSVLAPLLLSALRIPLLLLAFLLVSAALLVAGSAATWSAAWQVAADHSYVVLNVLVDLPCLLILAAVLRRDGKRLRDLLGPDGFQARRDLPRGLAVFTVMAVMFGLFPLLAQLVTGAPAYPSGITQPPLWVVAWTIVVFPLVTAPTEEFLFRGYAGPHLHAAARRRQGGRASRLVLITGAVLLPALGFGAAHMLIPPVGGVGALLARCLTLTAIGVVLDLLRLRSPHLAPLVLGHALVGGVLIGGFALAAAS